MLPFIAAGTAGATTSGDCQSATVQYRIVDADGKPVGADWSSQGGFHQWDSVPGTVEVRLAPGQNVGEGCKYPVSLAEYTTEGPNWFVSGHQTQVDKATVYLTAADVADSADAKQTWQKLTVRAPDCFGQIDLYGDDVSYDGKTGEGHGPLPYEPDNIATPYHLIAAWNGGDKKCTPATPASPTPSQSAPATPSTPAASQPPADVTTPPATPKPSSTPSTTPDVPPLSSTPPATPKPSPSDSKPPLAETGANGMLGPIAGGAALVIVAGAGAVVMSRRTRRS
ncbi:LAETG motif-containing sortase-dependent surface protein [Streptomyces sp. NPDC005236]|uniref:LAETG motif-containing sortase-dependent surface protein n=1 Tax=Streptomyces sp. NPDC005236 TaxID=3157028 RepID=UPI0033AB1D39